MVAFSRSTGHWCCCNRGFLGFWTGRTIPLLSLPLVAEFLTFYILSFYNSPGWLLETSCFPESGAIIPVGFSLAHRCWATLFWEHSNYWICFHYCTQEDTQGSGHRVGGGLDLALGVLGVPANPVGRSSGILPEACGQTSWWSPEADTKNQVPLMCFDILICFLHLIFPPLSNGGVTSVLWMLLERNGFL